MNCSRAMVVLSTALVLALAATTAALDRNPPDGLASSALAELQGPRGKVVERSTGEPVAGVVVRMGFGKRIAAETETGADGTFALPAPERSRRKVWVESEGWRATPHSFRLTEAQENGSDALLFEVERIVAARVRGRAIDTKTGEPIPHMLIEIQGPFPPVRNVGNDPSLTVTFQDPPRRAENVVTSADGRFETSGAFERGALSLHPADHPSASKGWGVPHDDSLQHEHDFVVGEKADEVDLRFSIGPTYSILADIPPGMKADDLYATFATPPRGLSGMHRAMASNPDSMMAQFLGSGLSALEPVAPLRETDSLWVRFRKPIQEGLGPKVHEFLDEDGFRTLTLRSHDGLVSGEGRVSAVEGIYPDPVRVELEARAVLRGTVRSPTGTPVPGAWIKLFDQARPDKSVTEVGAGQDGQFEARWLRPGQYDVVVESARFQEWRATTAVAGGETHELDVQLGSDVEVGRVSGTLRSRTGAHRSKGATVTLRSVDGTDVNLFRMIQYKKRDGQYTAHFAFDDVPIGDYQLEIDPYDNRRWETRLMHVTPPAEGLEFVCDDRSETFHLGVRAVDGATGAPIPDAQHEIWLDDPLDDVRLRVDWETKLYRDVPDDAAVHWVAGARGYRLARGTEAEFEDQGEQRNLTAALEPGWGQIFLVTTKERDPLAGVEIFADDVSVGTTDERGLLFMSLDAKPDALDFRYEDWSVVWGRVDPSDERFGSRVETPVYLAPTR